MSGGHFNYDQYRITQIAEDIQAVINKNKKPVSDPQPYDGEYYYDYSDEIIRKFKEAVYHLKIATVYAQRVDYLVSGDDGEESFLKRLKEDLSMIEK
jgi:hypothetical protein